MKNTLIEKIIISILFLLFVIAAYFIFKSQSRYSSYKYNVYSSYYIGQKIIKGGNPYKGQTDSFNKLQSLNKPIYPPLFYYFAGFTSKQWFGGYLNWLKFWRYLNFFLYSLLGLIYFIKLTKINYILAYLALCIWLFNRWTLNTLIISHFDFLTIIFFIIALNSIQKNKIFAFLMYGLALSLNQFVLYFLPLFLFIDIKNTIKPSILKLLFSLLLMMILPALISLQFLIQDFKGFISCIFSQGTLFQSNLQIFSVDTYIGLSGFTAYIPMLFLMLVTYTLFLFNYLHKYFTIFIVLLIILGFNKLIHWNYLMWIIAFVPLLIEELYCSKSLYKI